MRTKTLLFILIIFLQFELVSQHTKGQLEMNLPLTPYTALSQSYYANFEYFHNSKHSSTLTIGHQGSNLMYFWLSSANYSGNRLDIGQKWYLNNDKYVRFFVGLNSTFELSSLKIIDKPYLNISQDSLSAKGISFGPEINTGVKIVLFKNILISPAVGLRYYFSSLNSNSFTKNPTYWAYNDWGNNAAKWEDNRKQVDLNGFRKGLSKIPYFNIGFVLKL